MNDTDVDLRYDTAGIRSYAANMAAFFRELVRGGMSRREALAATLELIRTQVRNVKDDSA